MSRRTQGRLAPLTREQRLAKTVRNRRRGRPRFIIKTVARRVKGTRRRPGYIMHDRFRVPVEDQ